MAVNPRIAKSTSIIFLAAFTFFAAFSLWGCKKEKKTTPRATTSLCNG